MKTVEAIVRGDAWWPNPRCVVPGRGDGMFTGLLDSLHGEGPGAVPSRKNAARIATLGVSDFRRKFALWSGMTWRSFVTTWRVECGRVRLTTTDHLTKQVAAECGYRSEQGFSRAYHARFGEFPRSRRRGSD